MVQRAEGTRSGVATLSAIAVAMSAIAVAMSAICHVEAPGVVMSTTQMQSATTTKIRAGEARALRPSSQLAWGDIRYL